MSNTKLSYLLLNDLSSDILKEIKTTKKSEIYSLKKTILEDFNNDKPFNRYDEATYVINLLKIIYFFETNKMNSDELSTILIILKSKLYVINYINKKYYIILAVTAISITPVLLPIFIFNLERILNEKYKSISDISKEINHKDLALNLVNFGLVEELVNILYLLDFSDYFDVCLKILKKNDKFEFIEFLKSLSKENERGRIVYIGKLSILIENIFSFGYGSDFFTLFDYLSKLKPISENTNDSNKYYNYNEGFLYKNIIFDVLKASDYTLNKGDVKRIPEYLHKDVVKKIVENKKEHHLLNFIDDFSYFSLDQTSKIKNIISKYEHLNVFSSDFEFMCEKYRKKIIKILDNENNNNLLDVINKNNIFKKLENLAILVFILFFAYLFIWGPPNIGNKKENYLDSKLSKTSKSEFISIKYRDDPIDVSSSEFEYFNIYNQDIVKYAWYDLSNKYFIINLRGINYHYCDFSEEMWTNFKNSNQADIFYKNNIYGKYDCRLGVVPDY